MEQHPFLRRFRASDCARVFDLGAGRRPGSIRDQVVRATGVVRVAYAAGILSKGGEIGIVGAGPAGITAAIEANLHGVHATIFERTAAVAGLFGSCRSRRVEPLAYDWPYDRWDQPPDRLLRSLPVMLEASSAASIASKFEIAAQANMERDQIAFRGNTTVDELIADGEAGVLVKATHDAKPLTARVDLAIRCSGVRENNTLGTYVGPAFWSADDIASSYAGLGSPDSTMLISGSGDGALQDLHRAVFKKNLDLKEFITELVKHVPTSALRDLRIAQECFDLACNWLLTREELFAALRELDRTFENIASDRIAQPWLCDLINGSLRSDRAKLVIVMPRRHFDVCYAPNRFIGHLLRASVREKLVHGIEFLTEHRTSNVRCGHEVDVACWGHHHDVQLSQGGHTFSRDAQGVVIRHGIRGEGELPIEHEMLPYQVPNVSSFRMA